MTSAARTRQAGALWLLAGVFYLLSETIAAAAFPGYDYTRNYISDLGVPYATVHGRSSLAWVMNFGGFILDGVLYGAAAFVAARPGGRAFLLLAVVHSAGTILVGMIHSGPREIAAGIQHFHVIGAAMAIIGGNAASIAASRSDGPALYRRISLGLGLFGLISLAMLEANRMSGTAILPDGLFERGSVYPITLWEILTGAMLLTRKHA